jgi:hypothetical protein
MSNVWTSAGCGVCGVSFSPSTVRKYSFLQETFFRALEPLKKYRKTPQFAVSRCHSLGHRHTDKEGFHFAVAVSAGVERQDFVILPDRIANMREQAPCNRF